MTDDEVDRAYLELASEMFPTIHGKPCANVDTASGEVFVSMTITDFRIEDQTLYALCEWMEPDEIRPPELTNETVISGALLDVGQQWWLDIYFGWFLVFDSKLVSQSLNGNHEWVRDFLKNVHKTRTIPRPQPSMRGSDFPDPYSEMQYYG